MKIELEDAAYSPNAMVAWSGRNAVFISFSSRANNVICQVKVLAWCGLETHAIIDKSKATLWKRLSQHRGFVKSGGGNHRGSVFRKLIGFALAQRGDSDLPKSWGHGGSYSSAVQKLNLIGLDEKNAEADLERCVSDYVRQMPFLWLNVDDNPSPNSKRKYIERNAIALLSHAKTVKADVPSKQWLGKYCDRPLVQASGLWNNEHVEEDYDPKFLDVMSALVDVWA